MKNELVEPFPDWVPREVIDYWCMIVDNEEHPLRSTVLDEDIEVLVYCMEATSMENAWKAISRRSDRSDPRAFAHHIIETANNTRRQDRFPSRSEIANFRALSTRLSAIIDQFENAMESSTGPRLAFWQSQEPIEPLVKLKRQIDYYLRVCEREFQFFKSRVGKPNSVTWRRAWVIRNLTDQMWAMYGTPLHEVVAATSSIILDEDVDPDLVCGFN